MIMGLLACSATKGSQECAAKKLYQGDLFKASRKYLDLICGEDNYLILSAGKGLVAPNDPIAPYDEYLSTDSKASKWALTVAPSLALQLRHYKPSVVYVLAGKRYRFVFLVKEIMELLRDLKIELKIPLIGLGIGHQKQWLKRAIGE